LGSDRALLPYQAASTTGFSVSSHHRPKVVGVVFGAEQRHLLVVGQGVGLLSDVRAVHRAH
jgi:hypothetical protein